MVTFLLLIIIALILYSLFLMKKVSKEKPVKAPRHKTQVNRIVTTQANENVIDRSLIKPDALYASLPVDEQIMFLSEQDSGYVLEITQGKLFGKEINLIGLDITIGRSTGNDVTINDSMISEAHVKILIKSSSKVILKDLLSTNGTSLNGKKIEQVELREGDLITIGDTELKFKKGNI